MSWLNIHDFIVPTNPQAALFFGIIFVVIVSIFVWFDTRKVKLTIFSCLFASFIVVLLVGFLYMIGYYGAA